MTDAEHKERQSVLEEAKSWLGTPHIHMARIKSVGIDCGMYLLEVFERCGLIEHFDPGYYPHDFMLHRGEEWYKRIVESFCNPIQEDEALPGDVVLFRFGRNYSHGAIVWKMPIVIHSYLRYGVIFSDINKELLEGRERLFYRLKRWGG